ncbi:kDa neurofilament [Octopus vulgaris]|uniref:KDa neurofilament n=1 Tax=Octopus vulgaris TaxID=6645 RepID=A0AA36BQD2_OCTVU|nr:kDa neurofilament [Octopus vulgaris]
MNYSKTSYRKSIGTPSYPTTTTKIIRKSRVSSVGSNYGSPLHFKDGVVSSLSSKGATDIKCTREKEKKEMQDLNERFANYIEKVRFLETENKALKEALKKQKRDFNIEPMKAMYQTEIDELKKQLLTTTDENATLKARIATLEEEMEGLNGQIRHLKDVNEEQQNTIENLNEEISRRMSECEMLRRKVQELEKQLSDWKTRHSHLDSQLQALRIELQEETASRLAESTRAQSLEDELNFLKDIYETEIKEYKALLAKDNSFPDMREYWTSEMGSCIKEISQEYESQLEALASSLEARYESQISEIRMGTSKGAVELTQLTDENRRLKMQKSELEDRIRDLETQLAQLTGQLRSVTMELETTINDLDHEKEAHRNDVDRLQLELEGLMKELQDLMDAKLSMELEIAAYRKLLEGEEHRISHSSMVSSIGGFQTSSEEALSNAIMQRSTAFKSSMSAEGSIANMGAARITVHRSSSGPVAVVEIETNGQYISLEETGARKIGRPTNLKGWTLERQMEQGGKLLSHKFTDDVIFTGKIPIKVWGSKYSSSASKNDIVSHINEWGSATAVSKTVLKDENNMEKAVFIIKSISDRN